MGVKAEWEKIPTQEELDTIKKSVSDGKSQVANAITDKGITTAADAVFNTMANNISQINTLTTDTADATATAARILSGYTAYAKGKKLTGTYSPPPAGYTLKTTSKTGQSGSWSSGLSYVYCAFVIVGGRWAGGYVGGTSYSIYCYDTGTRATVTVSGGTVSYTHNSSGNVALYAFGS